jgi:hypothetical protein
MAIDREARAASREAGLVAALREGKRIRQIVSEAYTSVWPDCSPFLPECNTPEYLGHHLAIRERGFGFETIIL